MGNMKEIVDLNDMGSVLNYARRFDSRSSPDFVTMLGGRDLVAFAQGVLVMAPTVKANYDVSRRKADLLRDIELEKLRKENEGLKLHADMLTALCRKLDRRILAMPINFAERRVKP